MGIIRLALALSVVAAHSSPWPVFGFIHANYAVEMFFMISGFYMAMVLATKYAGRSPWDFLTNRLLRIYPTYWTVLLVTGALMYVGTFPEQTRPFVRLYEASFNNWSGLWALLVVALSNTSLLFQDVFMFLSVRDDLQFRFTSDFNREANPAWHFLLVPQAWTVSLELVFYALAPYLVRRRSFVLWVLVLLSVSIRLSLLSVGLGFDPWTYRFLPSEIAFFILGILSYRVKSRRIYPKVVIATILAITLLAQHSARLALPMLRVPASPFPIMLVLLAVSLLYLGMPEIFRISKNSRIDRICGELTYPVYISHVLVLTLIDALVTDSGHFSWLDGFGPRLLCIVVIAAALAWLIERPIDRVRQARITGPAPQPVKLHPRLRP
jgi:peptidoglycan/LPS O-acetylase OafA/YrhL